MEEPEDPGRAVVLVVEDEPLVRMLAADILEEEGFEVVEAATAPAALAIPVVWSKRKIPARRSFRPRRHGDTRVSSVGSSPLAGC